MEENESKSLTVKRMETGHLLIKEITKVRIVGEDQEKWHTKGNNNQENATQIPTIIKLLPFVYSFSI